VRCHVLGRLQCRRSVQVDQLVEATVKIALRARAVVTDDVVDERVLEDDEIVDRVDQPSDVVVGVLEEACISPSGASTGFSSAGGRPMRGSRRAEP
jgi:hypothetical protein